MSGQLKILQGRQKFQVTCPAGQVVSIVSVEPCKCVAAEISTLAREPATASYKYMYIRNSAGTPPKK